VTWLRVDDTGLTHPRCLHLRTIDDKVSYAEAVVGWVMLAATWSGQQNSDCFVPEAAGVMAGPQHWQNHARLALKVGLIKRADLPTRKANGGQRGWLIVIGEGELFHLLSKEELAARKERRNITRRIPEKVETLLRDGDQCRYCADPVNEYDRKGAKQREMDHPDPDDPSVVVVACKECNGEKAKRSVEQWVAAGGRPLLDPPADRGVPLILRPKTREWLEKQNVLLDGSTPSQGARTGSQPDDAAPLPAADQAQPSTAPSHDAANRPAADPAHRPEPGPDPGTATRGVAGRDLPGRVGSGSGLAPSPSSGDPPRRRTRGSRGRRRQPPAAAPPPAAGARP
jgi:hypothetical protein